MGDSLKHFISITETNRLKFWAIMMVIVSHYYRFADSNSPFHFFSSIGFFGASLFAFLSGYGVSVSYMKKGIGGSIWLLNKLRKVYIPFVFVNIISVFVVYGMSDPGTLFARIVFGTDDPVMWYIPFILMFYLIFWIIYKMNISIFWRHCLLVLCGVIWIGVGCLSGIASQWYTSTGALILGCIVAEYDSKLYDFKKSCWLAVISLVVFIGFAYMSRHLSSIMLIKDITTVMSGMGFSLLSFT